MKIQTKVDNLNYYKIYLGLQEAAEEFLQKKGYLKIDLPVLSPVLIPESYLEVFETEFRYLNRREKLYLTPSPELFLKRLLACGIGDCYYLGKSFRNSEPTSSWHSFEFTMLEFYKINAFYMDLADEVLAMLKYINSKLKAQSSKLKSKNSKFKTTTDKLTIIYQNKSISLSKWEKITVAEAFERYADISQEELFNHKLLANKAKKKGYQTKNATFEDLFSQIYVQEIEPHLGNNGYPTLIYDYPKELAALAKLNPDGKTAQRFEFYIAGVELGDCYTELTDWKEQEIRFKNEDLKRKKARKISHPIDKDFIEALKYGFPECAGIAIGVERLAMIFANITSIKDIKLINIE